MDRHVEDVRIYAGWCSIWNWRRPMRLRQHNLTAASERRVRRWRFEQEQAAWDAEQRDYRQTVHDSNPRQ